MAGLNKYMNAAAAVIGRNPVSYFPEKSVGELGNFLDLGRIKIRVFFTKFSDESDIEFQFSY